MDPSAAEDDDTLRTIMARYSQGIREESVQSNIAKKLRLSAPAM